MALLPRGILTPEAEQQEKALKALTQKRGLLGVAQKIKDAGRGLLGTQVFYHPTGDGSGDAFGYAPAGPTVGEGLEMLSGFAPGIGEAQDGLALREALQRQKYGQAVLPAIGLALPAIAGLGSLGKLMSGDVSKLRKAKGLGGNQLGATVYHGSPHQFDEFSMDAIGTGEGAQAYGHGLYFAESPDVAKNYAPRDFDFEDELLALYKKSERVGDYDAMEAYEAAMMHGTPSEIAEFMGGRAKSAQDEIAKLYAKSKPQFYTVDLPDEAIDKMLDWDAPLSEQPEAVQDAIRKAAASSDNPYPLPLDHDPTGGEILGMMSAPREVGQERASMILKKHGIPGIKYLDGGSRATGEGTRNFVAFDDKLVKILERE